VRELTVQLFRKLISQAANVRSSKNSMDARGHFRENFARPWRELGIDLSPATANTVGTIDTG
jgi:hypothetical protein